MEDISGGKNSQLRLSVKVNDWTKTIQDHLVDSLFQEDTQASGNISFVCKDKHKISWNGLAYLASISNLFQARSREEQNFTVILPDIEASLLTKLLMLMTNGQARVKLHEVEALRQLASDMGVSSF